MAGLFKFRCSECTKLLGVSHRKVGKAIHCPQCQAELIVPSPDDAEPAGGSGEEEEALEFEGLGIDLGFSSPLAVRPDDLPPSRPPDEVEALAFLERATTATPNPRPVRRTSAPRPVSSDQIEVRKHPADFALPPEEEDSDDTEAGANDEAEPLIQDRPEPLIPKSRRVGRVESVTDRRRDVVLPRTAVITWSLFAIFALAFSFLAGLMIGHYRWK